MNKLEFEDIYGDYGYIEYVEGEMNWGYEGDIEEVYQYMFSHEGMEGHGRPEDATGDSQVDGVTEFSPEEKIRGIIRQFDRDTIILALWKNEERVW